MPLRAGTTFGSARKRTLDPVVTVAERMVEVVQRLGMREAPLAAAGFRAGRLEQGVHHQVVRRRGLRLGCAPSVIWQGGTG